MQDQPTPKSLFEYPLVAALANRRARRFPLGCAFPEDALHHASTAEPRALDARETAWLCWAGNGISGTVAGDLPISGGNVFGNWAGRTTPYACNVHNVRLFFTNDDGTFVYHPTEVPATAPQESGVAWDTITAQYRQGVTKVSDARVEFTPKALLRSIHWNTNHPGTTVFIPVVDQTVENIDFLLGVFDYEGYGYKLFDHLTGDWAGLGEVIASGGLKGPKIGLASYEFTMLQLNLAPAYMMLQNVHLAAEAAGLGAVVFGGYTGTVMLGATPLGEGLGFHIENDAAGKPNPVGLDDVFEAYCPPYYANMDDAVDAVVEHKFGPRGIFGEDYTGETPFKDWLSLRPQYHHPSKASIALVKAYCRYVFETYGRFPATYDTKVIPMWLQVHHLETEFYDAHYPPEILTEAQRSHMARWHGESS